MRYAQINKSDMINGLGVGVSLFTQGCRFQCPHCFNPETWDVNGGQEFTSKEKDMIFTALNHSYINRFSVLGGEPLIAENLDDLIQLLSEVKTKYPDIKIWVYTGYTIEYILENKISMAKRYEILKYIDVLVDGRYMHDLRDVSLPFRGSSNQRLINVQATLQNNILE